MSAPGVGVELDSDRVIETYPVDGQQGREIEWVVTGGPIGKIRVLERTIERRPGEGAWQLAAELVRLLGQRTEERGEEEQAGRLRRGVLFSECLKAVHAWLAHDKIAVLESDLGGDGMRDLARSAILDALKVQGKPARKVGVPSDARRELRSAGEWRRFMTGLKEIVELERSELNVAACHSRLEADISRVLDASERVDAFVRNHGPERMEIPYKYKGGWGEVRPGLLRAVPTQKREDPAHRARGEGTPRRAKRAQGVVD